MLGLNCIVRSRSAVHGGQRPQRARNRHTEDVPAAGTCSTCRFFLPFGRQHSRKHRVPSWTLQPPRAQPQSHTEALGARARGGAM